MLGKIAAFPLCVACSTAPSTPPTSKATIVRDAAPVVTAPMETVDAGTHEAEPRAVVERVLVANDTAASIVRGRDGAKPHIVFMPGLCSNAHAYLLAFPETARDHDGVVAIEGDEPCGTANGFRSFTWSATLQRKRVDAALAAAGVTTIPEDGLTLVGYSAGASIAELMHYRWPEIFARLVLIAPPIDPDITHLRGARGVVAMSCSLDVPYRMKAAVRDLSAARVPATYLEMPQCTHGMISDGERVFGDAFDWLDAHAAIADDFFVRIEQSNGADYAKNYVLLIDARGNVDYRDGSVPQRSWLRSAKLGAIDGAITRARFFSQKSPDCKGTDSVHLDVTVQRAAARRTVHEACAFSPLWLANLVVEILRIAGIGPR